MSQRSAVSRQQTVNSNQHRGSQDKAVSSRRAPKKAISNQQASDQGTNFLTDYLKGIIFRTENRSAKPDPAKQLD